jgi:uncharacterized protein (TIGR02598 family)
MKHYVPVAASSRGAFSLVEVVLALGIISFAIVAILGVFPLGLQTGHSSEDDTRSTQIAQNVLNAMASQSQQNFTNIVLPYPSPPLAINLASSSTSPTAPAAFFYADNDGQISGSATNATYSISIITDNFITTASPAPFDSGFANKVTVRIVSPPLATASATPNPGQTAQDYVRVISKY